MLGPSFYKLIHKSFIWIWACALIFFAFVSYVVDEIYFNHQYAIVAEYKDEGVKKIKVDLLSKRGIRESQIQDSRVRDDGISINRFIFKTRRPAESFKFTLLDDSDLLELNSNFSKIVVKTKWGEEVEKVFSDSRVIIKPVHGTWTSALERNSTKIVLIFILTAAFVSVVQSLARLSLHGKSIISLYAVVIFLTLLSGEVITDRTIFGDGVGQLRAAYNLYAYNIFAERLGSPPVPDNFIEPFPAFVNSLYFRLLELSGFGPLSFEEMHWGQSVYVVKQINLFWVFLGQISLALFVYFKTRKLWVAVSTLVAAYVFFFGNFRVVNTFYTELQGGVLILLSSIGIFFLFENYRVRAAFLTAISLALLALTKASYFYINFIIILLIFGLLFYDSFKNKKLASGQVIRLMLVIVVAYAAVLGPWILRNYIHFNSTAISDRGGVVLYIRATKNQMTAEEVRGAFYLYGPSIYHHLGGKWGYARPHADELDPNHGAWMRVNRNRSPNSFFAGVRNELRDAMQKVDSNGNSVTLNEVAADMNRKALASIASDPVKHLGMSFVFLWRGMWGVAPVDFYLVKSNLDLIVAEIAVLFFYIFSFFFFLFSWFKLKIPYIAFGLVTLGGVSFYALLSHFLPRYMLPYYPTLIVMSTFISFYVLRYIVQVIRVKMTR